ncbi:MAG: DUF4153 domain-containing protein [Candidatus Woesearchaeota archaeon]
MVTKILGVFFLIFQVKSNVSLSFASRCLDSCFSAWFAFVSLLRSKRFRYVFLLLVVFLFSFPQVFSYQEDYKVFTSGISTALVGGAITQNTLIIQNTGTVDSVYYLSLGGNAASFATLSEPMVTAKPGKTATVYLFFNPPSATEGTYQLTLTITTDFETTKVFSFPLTVSKGSPILVDFPYPSYENLPCSDTLYSLTIKNPNPYDDVYDIGIDGFTKDEYSLSASTLMIPAHSQTDVVFVLRPLCSRYGDLPGRVKIVSRTTKDTYFAPFLLHVRQEYDFSITPGSFRKAPESPFLVASFLATDWHQPYQACKEEGIRIPIKIENVMHFGNRYELSLPARSWLGITNTSIYVPAHDARIVELYVRNPSPGTYSIPIKATAMLGNVVQEKTLLVEVVACYQWDVVFDNFLSPVCEDYDDLSFTLTNKGSKDLTLGLEGEHLILQQDVVYLPAYEKKTITAEFYPVNASGTYSFSLLTFVLDTEDYAQNLTGSVTIVKEPECVVLDAEAFVKTNYYHHTTYDFVVWHKGITEAEYHAYVLTNHSWISLSPTSFTLGPGKRYHLPISVSAPADVPEGKYEFLLHISPITSEERFVFPGIVVLKHPSLFEQAWFWLNMNKVLGFMLLLFFLLLLLLLFLLLRWLFRTLRKTRKQQKQQEKVVSRKRAEQRKDKRKTSRTELWKALLGLLLLLFLIFLILVLLYVKGCVGEHEPAQPGEEDGEGIIIANDTSFFQTTTTTTTTLRLQEPVRNNTDAGNQTPEDGRISEDDQGSGASFLASLREIFKKVAGWFSAKSTEQDSLASSDDDNQTAVFIDNQTQGIVQEITSTTTTTVFSLEDLTLVEAVALSQEREDETILLDYLAKKDLTQERIFQIWAKNTNATFVLDEYFFDPDHDPLYYTYSLPQHVQVRLDQGVVTFIPPKDWKGVDEIVFKADDGKGGVSLSPTIYLIVTEPLHVQKLAASEFFSKYGWYLATAVLLGLFAVLFILAFSKKERA